MKATPTILIDLRVLNKKQVVSRMIIYKVTNKINGKIYNYDAKIHEVKNKSYIGVG